VWKIDQYKANIEIYEEIKKKPELWYLFTKKEEYNPIKLDKYGRFAYKFSSHKNALESSVSKYLIKQGFCAEYPDNKKFAIILTHDIDDVDISLKQFFHAITQPPDRFISGFKKLLIEKLRERTLSYANFKKIIQLERKYDATSSFYFLATKKDVFGFKYNLEDIQDEIFYILDEKCEVGLHTGYYSFDNVDQIKIEKEKLEKIIRKKIIGARNHVLRFKIPRSWELLANAGFEYDTSFGYYDMIGFRNGMCHPFQPFNLIQNKETDILEIPLCVMDITLFSYMKIGAEKSWGLIKNLIDTVEELNGVLTVLWHNWTFSFPVSYAGMFGKEWTSLYEKILEYCYKKNAWMTSSKEICEYYKKNGILKKRINH
jgi:peptidoglycan/xylan/chitin deacetylase (PgdA/CDA1 family)